MSKPASLAITVDESETPISEKLQDYQNHVLIRQKSQQLAGETAVPHSDTSRCQVDKHGTGLLLSLKRVLDISRLVQRFGPRLISRVEIQPAPREL